MPPEAQMEHPPMALLVGSVPCRLEAQAARAVEAGWRFSQVGDVYAALAALLRTDRPRPDVVLVLVESLRGDELRFFDSLARRWPGLPAAAVHCDCPEDRRLEACRRRGVTVLAAQAVVEWLGQQNLAEPAGPDVESAPSVARPSPAEQGVEPAAPVAQPPQAAVPVPVPPPPSQAAPAAVQHPVPGGQDSSAVAQPAEEPSVDGPPPALAGVEVTLDLPDELADLPDPGQAQAGPVDQTEYDPADLPDEPDGPDQPQEEDEEGSPNAIAEEADLDGGTGIDGEVDEEQDVPRRVPLTPWSEVPRPERRRPGRKAPLHDGNGQPERPPVDHPADGLPPGGEITGRGAPGGSPPALSGPSSSAAGTGKPPSTDRSAPAPGWEHGLLTPEELRALLQETDQSDPGEAQP